MNTSSNGILTLDAVALASSTTARNHEVVFDQNMSFNSHIKQNSRTTFIHLYDITKIRHILSQKDAEKLVHAFVTSRLDYCNLLLSDCPKKLYNSLQLVRNAAAGVTILISSLSCSSVFSRLVPLHPVAFCRFIWL